MSNEPVMRYYDADGNVVKENDDRAVVQYLSDDPNRPDAAADDRGTPAEVSTPHVGPMARTKRIAAPRRSAKT